MGTWNNCRIRDMGTTRVGGTDTAGTGDMGTRMGAPVGLGTVGDGDTKGWGNEGMGTRRAIGIHEDIHGDTAQL